MQVADLFRPPLGVLSVKCPSRANQASGLAGGFDFDGCGKSYHMGEL